ncbi:hypothetical protein HBI52_111580 [Parastagonospora nodorum]|nr:hypothetical protein HBH43_008170 [Parastagonospora nodorum]KAH5208270.1 hypothetical protein HBH68_084990 [Parastagonospora nodorum]KAH5376257.1 hypothetical protein HBI48_012240 [Parastagonospora nodorum]KAH5470857.1 hypothetical protein HBI28_153060 [Parastagonospora nodorum]KAH5515203.1 hypothetical protein HBI52_111580 [Parastagonospora nodorum]
MAYEHSGSHSHGSGWVRNGQVQDQNGSRRISYSRDEYSTREGNTAYSNTRSNDRNDAADDHLQDYHFDGYASNSGTNRNMHSRYPRQHSDRQESYRHQDLHRAWQSVNPEIDRVINDVAVREAILRLEGRTHHHNCSSVRQLQPTLSQNRRHQTHSSEWYERNSRPLGRSNLRNLDLTRGPTNATRRWRDEDQRSGPYNNIGQVGRQSDYERGAPQQYEQDEEEYEYDDQSDTLY